MLLLATRHNDPDYVLAYATPRANTGASPLGRLHFTDEYFGLGCGPSAPKEADDASWHLCTTRCGPGCGRRRDERADLAHRQSNRCFACHTVETRRPLRSDVRPQEGSSSSRATSIPMPGACGGGLHRDRQ